MTNGDSRAATELAVSSVLERGLSDLDDPATAEQTARLVELVMLVSEWAQRISLTGHRDPLELARHLVLDAAALAHALPELATAERLSDLGSGVGFPGLPIAILRPHLEVVLVESRSKRHHLQREIRRRLGLTRVVPVLGRSDEVESLPSDVVVAQAMTQPERALALMRPWARAGGIVVLPASASSLPPGRPDGFAALTLREYRVPSTDRLRRLWIAEALGDPAAA